MAKNASKEAVIRKLQVSRSYCDSHHTPVQPLFEELVDELITPERCPYDPSARAKEMKCLYPILSDEKTQGMVPSIPMGQETLDLDPEDFLRHWLGKWIGKFTKEWETLPSDREAQAKRTVTDPALLVMVGAQGFAGDMDTAGEWALHHNLFMSAENAGGNLLEEYIASRVADYGWIWCRGKILTAIDFCNDECTAMFQVKNKTNTENSSGKGFREARGAQVWCRMRAERRNGKVETFWPQLVDIVRGGATRGSVPDDLMTEEGYLDFVRGVTVKNPYLISGAEQ